MLVLLPPSEGKASAPRRGRPADPATWAFPELGPTRERVAKALHEASAGHDRLSVLGVSEALREEVLANLDLTTAPARPAAEVYTGVLYDAFGYAGLDPAARRRANRWVLVFSALHGVLRLTDRIAPYRLAIGTRLPLTGPLEPVWRTALSPVLTEAAGSGIVVDARSGAYAAMWRPSGAVAERWVSIAVPGASHMAKHTRGLVARHLAVVGATPRTPAALAEVAARGFDADLAPPVRPNQPWVLSVRPPT